MLSCGQTIDEEEDTEPDVSYQLLEQARRNGFAAKDWNWLSGDAVLAIVAEGEWDHSISTEDDVLMGTVTRSRPR